MLFLIFCDRKKTGSVCVEGGKSQRGKREVGPGGVLKGEGGGGVKGRRERGVWKKTSAQRGEGREQAACMLKGTSVAPYPYETKKEFFPPFEHFDVNVERNML